MLENLTKKQKTIVFIIAVVVLGVTTSTFSVLTSCLSTCSGLEFAKETTLDDATNNIVAKAV